MKTITEFSGFVLTDALKKLIEVTPRPARVVVKPLNKKNDVKAIAAAAVAVTAEAPTESQALEAQTSEAPAAEVQATENHTQKNETEQAVAPESSSETSSAAEPATVAAATTETVAEPDAAPVVDAAPAVNVTALMGEAFKMEGDKLVLFMNALELAKRKPQHIKRIVIGSLTEGEKAPANSFEKDGKVYMMEHFFVPQPVRNDKRDFRGGRGGRDGGGKFGGKGGRGGKGGSGGEGRGDNRGPRKPFQGPRPAANANGPAPKITPRITPRIIPNNVAPTADTAKKDETAKAAE